MPCVRREGRAVSATTSCRTGEHAVLARRGPDVNHGYLGVCCFTRGGAAVTKVFGPSPPRADAPTPYPAAVPSPPRRASSAAETPLTATEALRASRMCPPPRATVLPRRYPVRETEPASGTKPVPALAGLFAQELRPARFEQGAVRKRG
jgi:hypothetical protein